MERRAQRRYRKEEQQKALISTVPTQGTHQAGTGMRDSFNVRVTMIARCISVRRSKGTGEHSERNTFTTQRTLSSKQLIEHKTCRLTDFDLAT